MKKKRDPRKSELIRQMVELYQPKNMSEFTEMFKDMFADTLEDMLKAELDEELGYEKHDQQPKSTTNRRNGSYPKTVHTSNGDMTLEIPRDREGKYEPQVVPKGTTDLSAIEEKVILLYSMGTSDRDISKTIDEIYGFTLSAETISRIVDRVKPRVIEWMNRRLEKVYPFVYMDALMISVKSSEKAGKQAFYTIIGVDPDGKKDCLGFWTSENEGVTYWVRVLDELKTRGVEKLGFVCIDGLKGLKEAITDAFPEAIVCRCMVHLIRNSMKYVPEKDRKAFCTDLKKIYAAVSEIEARAALEAFEEKWQEKYAPAVRIWKDNYCYVEQLFGYPKEIRKMIYTTNTIESFNAELRKITRGKGSFPNVDAVFKALYLREQNIVKKWTMPFPNWGIIRAKLDLLWGDGWCF